MGMVSHPPLSFLPSPSVNGFNIGPLFVHVYGLMYVVGIALAIYITRRRWRAAGGDPTLVADVATWGVPAGIIGGRIYFDITTPADITPHVWWGVFAVWSGGLGIWGGVILGTAVAIWRVRRAGASWTAFANAAAPALLVAQAVGRIGNYFNQELFGKPSGLPWALEIARAHRPAGYTAFATFQPTFLYELIWDLALAAALVWLGHHRRIRPPGLFALYVAGYSAFRIFEETLRIDSSVHILGLRLNFFVALIGTIAGLAWFAVNQRRPDRRAAEALPAGAAADGGSPGEADRAEPGAEDGEDGAGRAGTAGTVPTSAAEK
jgi:prolipoprotein diacylglyceryl transferase